MAAVDLEVRERWTLPRGASSFAALAAALPGISVELLGERMDGPLPFQQVRIVLEREDRTDAITIVLGPGGPIKAHVVAWGDLSRPAAIRTEAGIAVGAAFAKVSALAEHACAVERHDTTDEVFWVKPRAKIRYQLGAPGLALPDNLWSETAETWIAHHKAQLVVTSIVWGNSLGMNPFRGE